jgi:SAM-dependent methyltransferase
VTKTIESKRDWRSHWASIGQRATRDEAFQQAERTVGGRPVPHYQIELLIAAIKYQLALGWDDVLLDLCCGNGLVTARLSPFCRVVVGVDYSLELIESARERRSLPNTVYMHRDAANLHPADFPAGLPTKVCMNAGMQYFTEPMARRLFQILRELSQQDLMVLLTDIPDAAKLEAFYNTPERWAEFERRSASGTEAIGTWWDRDHLVALARAMGYTVATAEPESGRSTAHYRFDLLARLAY